MAGPRDESFSPTASWTDTTDDSNDDDMDFELATEDVLSTEVDDDEEEGETTLYFDAEEGTFRTESGAQVEFTMTSESSQPSEEPESGENAEEDRSPTPQPAARPTVHHITQQQILALLQHAGIRGILQPSGVTTRSQAARAGHAGRHVALADDENDNEEEEDDDDEYAGYGARRSRRLRRTFVGDRYPKIPSDEGKTLMDSGTFGTTDHCDHSACGLPFSDTNINKRRKLARRMFDREIGAESRGRSRALASLATQNMFPSSKADLIVNLNARCYSGQFSDDGSFFFACGQDFKVRMYDTSNPYDWKYYKTSHYYGGQWTITDASLSPDNKLLAYSSIRSQICMANTDQGDTSEPRLLDFSDMGSGRHEGGGGGGWHRGRNHFGIWSLRFSGDGGEIVAGTSDSSVYVYDLETQRSILRIPGHTEDVNAVCFGDKMSPHILYSGSDDTTLKVWDRRSLASMRPAGMFLGHTEGLTYIDSKGDGRYVISNGKDQTCKLWDLRKMISTDVGERINPQDKNYTTNFDYRFSPYDTAEHTPHPHDCSLVTFRGHRVLKTLIRCHFSPAGSTDGRYIYSGSHDGKIYVWNMDGTEACTPINVLAATKNSRPQADERYVDRFDYYGNGGTWKTIVRDCSWHPSAPVIAATSWNGWDHGLGTCTVHSWSDGADGDEVGDYDARAYQTGEAFRDKSSLGSTPMGARVTAQLHHDDRYYGTYNAQSANERRQRLRNRMQLGALWRDEEDEY